MANSNSSSEHLLAANAHSSSSSSSSSSSPSTESPSFTHTLALLSANKPLLLVTLFAVLGGFLFGFDVGGMGGVIVMDDFRDAFGIPRIQSSVADDASTSDQLGWIVALLPLSAAITALLVGTVADKASRRTSIFVGSLIFSLGGLAQALAPRNEWIYIQAGRVLGGIGIGILSTIVPVYVAEMASAELRGALNTLFQLSITVGIVFAFLVNIACTSIPLFNDGGYGWRYAVGVQSLLGSILVLGIRILPESPRLLMGQLKEGEARAILQRLRIETPVPPTSAAPFEDKPESLSNGSSSSTHAIDAPSGKGPGSYWLAKPIRTNIDAEIEEMRAAIFEELKAGELGWFDLFAPQMRLRVIVGCMMQFAQQLSFINAVIYFAPSIFSLVGINAFLSTALVGVVNVLATLLTIKFIDSSGRVPLLFWSGIGMFLSCIFIAIVFALTAEDDQIADYLIAMFVCTHVICFAFGWGPCAWIFCSEIYPLAARGKAVALTTTTNWLGSFAVGLLVPYMLSSISVGPTFGIISICLVFVLAYTLTSVPETRNRSLESMPALFQAESLPSLIAWMSNNYKNNFAYLKQAVAR